MSAPIVIPRYVPTFRDLQVGDVFLVNSGSWGPLWDARTVTRVTDRHFIRGYGAVKPSGLHEYQEKYDRDTGDRYGERFKRAFLPTREFVAEINAELADRANRITLRAVEWRKLTNEQAEQVCALLATFTKQEPTP